MDPEGATRLHQSWDAADLGAGRTKGGIIRMTKQGYEALVVQARLDSGRAAHLGLFVLPKLFVLPDYLSSWRGLMPKGLLYRIRGKDGMPQVLIPAGVFRMGATPSQVNSAFEQYMAAVPQMLIPTDEGWGEVLDELKRKAPGATSQQLDTAWEKYQVMYRNEMIDALWDGFRAAGPQKRVHVSAFWMDLHDVTVAQYRRFCVATSRSMPVQPTWNQDSHPVVKVSWDDADAYGRWVGASLPTEAQWEKAARGGDEASAYVWGDTWPPPRGAGNFADESAKRGHGTDWGDERLASYLAGYDDGFVYTSPVGSCAPNGYGLFDMAGNVCQWCEDWYDKGWYAEMAVQDPLNQTQAERRVVRGGSFHNGTSTVRVADRKQSAPGDRSDRDGFRCAQAP